MKITGQILKENRERKGISISEVAIATKINNKTLLAIESGNLDQLPPKTFLRGFVRAYASYLELDVDSIMNTYFEEMGSTRPKSETAELPSDTPPTVRQKPAPNEANDAINPKTSLAVKAGAFAGIFLLIVLIMLFKNKMESYEKEALDKSVPGGLAAVATPGPGAEMSTPPSEAAAAAALAGGVVPTPSPTPMDATAAVAVATTPTPTPSPNPTPSPTPASQSTPTPTPKPTPSPTPTPTPKPTATPTPTPAPTATPTPQPTPAPVEAVAPSPAATATPRPAGRPQEVIIEALDNVSVDATVDDEAPKKMQLHAEQVQNIKAKRRVVLRFSDGGAVNLIVNGVERGVPGDLGKPTRVELP